MWLRCEWCALWALVVPLTEKSYVKCQLLEKMWNATRECDFISWARINYNWNVATKFTIDYNQSSWIGKKFENINATNLVYLRWCKIDQIDFQMRHVFHLAALLFVFHAVQPMVWHIRLAAIQPMAATMADMVWLFVRRVFLLKIVGFLSGTPHFYKLYCLCVDWWMLEQTFN